LKYTVEMETLIFCYSLSGSIFEPPQITRCNYRDKHVAWYGTVIINNNSCSCCFFCFFWTLLNFQIKIAQGIKDTDLNLSVCYRNEKNKKTIHLVSSITFVKKKPCKVTSSFQYQDLLLSFPALITVSYHSWKV
jgi:hypothetical protein